jgi:hypothetical protein
MVTDPPYGVEYDPMVRSVVGETVVVVVVEPGTPTPGGAVTGGEVGI